MALMDILGGLVQGFAPGFEQTTSDMLKRRIEAERDKQRRQLELDLLAEKSRLEGESALAGRTRTLSPFLEQPKNVAGDYSITNLGETQAIKKAVGQGYGVASGPSGVTLTRQPEPRKDPTTIEALAVQEMIQTGQVSPNTQRLLTESQRGKGSLLDELYNAPQPVNTNQPPGVVEAGEGVTPRPAPATPSPEERARTVVTQMKQKGATFRETRMALQEMGYDIGAALTLANKYYQ